ncbi:tetratricopeptide repeat protein [Hyphomicrobium sp.]|uniref:tetratricopeptide repeat protein n=1 Tax=Hyphomicrobium sp. TaxID=82 RepID=UPI002E30CFF9|nr:tetratricopeptide repeat protein [Hyphomicrobium sp.]HEX2842270.1 tetratricopeptide repeat protein [Hyphomicrobium sp.]
MQVDLQGLPLTGADAESARLYRQGIDELVLFKNSVFDTLDQAISASPNFPMASFAKAYLHLFMTEPASTAVAASTITELKKHAHVSSWSDRERAHAEAIDAWIAGDMRRAARVLDRLGLDEPRDILGLRIGHELDFFSGNTRNLKDRVARQLGQWHRSDAQYGVVQGCYAFGLEENGEYERAEDHGRLALEYRPDDVWAIHAVTHSLEMRGAIGAGLSFLGSRNDSWASGNLFSAHNWWHKGLFHLDLGEYDRALQVYDQALFHDNSPKIALVLLDASALLWRIHLEGVNVRSRFEELSTSWETVLPDVSHYVFNDVHAVMAHVGAGKLDEARRVVANLEAFVSSDGKETNNRANGRRVGIPLARAFLAFGEQRYRDAAEEILNARGHAVEFGGSAAQRDVLDRTLLEAAIRSGWTNLATSLASERITARPENPYGWIKSAVALEQARKTIAAANARETSERLKTRVHSAASSTAELSFA